MTDWNNDYTHAGPGRKRREKLALANIAQPLASRTIKPKAAPKALSQRTPKRETREITAQGLKARIRRLTLQGSSFREVCDELDRANISASGVLVSSVRTDTKETIQLLIEEGLLEEEQLETFRRQHKRGRKG